MYGYENWVEINGVFIPATSADTQVDRSKIESSGIYGGSITGTGVPIGQVHYYDWPIVSASFSADASSDFLSLVKTMIFNRSTPVSMVLHSGASGTQTIEQGWWNSISLQTSEDSAVTANISLTAVERQVFDVNSFESYWTNTYGNLASSCEDFSTTSPLNSDINHAPVPFWKTKIKEFQRVKSWSISLTQDVVRFMGCMNYAGAIPQSPYILGVGVINASMKISTCDELYSDIWAMPDKYADAALNIRMPLTIQHEGTDYLSFDGELVLANDALQGMNMMDGIDYDYQIYKIS